MKSPARIFATVIISAALLIGVFAGCKSKSGSKYPSETRDAFGTKVTVTIFDTNQKPETLKRVFDEVFPLITAFETKTVKPGPDNQVLALTKGAGEQSVPVDQQVFDFLMKAMRYYDYGGQSYDIRYGPMLDAWGFDGKPRVPDKVQLDTLRNYVGEGGMFVAGNSILLARPGMRFDVREIALGHALDLAAARLAELGFASVAVTTPSVSRFVGTSPDARGFEAIFRNPLNPDSVWATVRIPAGAVAMKSVSDGKFTAGGQSYHRILDPRTGSPTKSVAAAIVQTNDAISAEALAYSLFVTASVDSFDTNGKATVGGFILARETGGKLTEMKSGSLANTFALAK